MNAIRNKVHLIGNLGTAPELKEFKSGRKMARFSLATSDYYKDDDGKKVSSTQWHNLVIWGGLADVAAQYLDKGSQVAVEGKLTYRSYENKDGEKRFFTEIVVSDMVMFNKNKT
jgi:single-strand DNA-binding protein